MDCVYFLKIDYNEVKKGLNDMKFKKVLIAPALFMLLTMASCGQQDAPVSLPTSAHEKVQFALNGVEKSLKANNFAKNKAPNKGQRRASEPTSATLNTIWNALENKGVEDQPDVGYNDTPLIQFQYLKALYEETGDDFLFNVKYSHTFTGVIYYDFTADEEASGEEYKNDYNFVFSVLINIDDNDLITANVGFDITFTANNDVRHECMYAELELDYDMDNANPNFVFTMRDITDLLEYPNEEERQVTAEYNYINVRDNRINEYRKYCVQAKEGFDHYEDEDFKYKYAALKGFKNSTSYKLSDPFIKDNELKEAVIVGVGLKETLESYKSFYLINGEENGKIATVVNRFNQILGKDFIYHLAESGADEEWESHEEPPSQGNTFLWFMKENNYYDSFGFADDFCLQQLFAEYKVAILRDDYELIDLIEDPMRFNIKVKSRSYPETKWIDVNNPYMMFSELVVESGYIYKDSAFMYLDMDVSLKEDPNIKIPFSVELNVKNEDMARELARTWPKDYLDLHIFIKDVIPQFQGNNVYFGPGFREEYHDGQVVIDGKKGYVNLYNATTSEVKDYADALVNAHGFQAKVDFYSGDVSYYHKRVNDNYILKIYLAYPNGKEETIPAISFEFEENVVPETSIRDYVSSLINDDDVSVPEFTASNEYMVLEDYQDKNKIRIPNVTCEEAMDYVASFGDYGFRVVREEYRTYAIIYLHGKFIMIDCPYEKGFSVYVTPVLFSFVGLNGNWDEKNEDHVFTDFQINNNMEYGPFPFVFKYKYNFQNGEAFKVILNHDWAQGSYGYERYFFGDKPDDNIHPEGEYNNIQIVQGKAYDIAITFAL